MGKRGLGVGAGRPAAGATRSQLPPSAPAVDFARVVRRERRRVVRLVVRCEHPAVGRGEHHREVDEHRILWSLHLFECGEWCSWDSSRCVRGGASWVLCGKGPVRTLISFAFGKLLFCGARGRAWGSHTRRVRRACAGAGERRHATHVVHVWCKAKARGVAQGVAATPVAVWVGTQGAASVRCVRHTRQAWCRGSRAGQV